jgi:hypothetical protein
MKHGSLLVTTEGLSILPHKDWENCKPLFTYEIGDFDVEFWDCKTLDKHTGFIISFAAQKKGHG